MDAGHKLILVLTAMISATGCAAPFPPPGLEREEVLEVGTPTVYLNCPPGDAASPDTRNIGVGGGALTTAGHELTIPAGAVGTQRAITLRERQGQMLGVEIEHRAESGALARSATLWIDARRCSSDSIRAREWFVWRLNPAGGPSQKLRTRMAGSRFMTQIDSTSGFIIAH